MVRQAVSSNLGFASIEKFILKGIVVDTHVHRLSNRMGLSKENTPEKIEVDLMGLVPRSG
ncbi:MAG: hypothetical protein HYS08_10785 [Chlamydiae bacterium]|nr:hypothetical protein [Chlamydiota bacterium]MBI3266610.1 hypothetical protein [Chlamydiota bacterium]